MLLKQIIITFNEKLAWSKSISLHNYLSNLHFQFCFSRKWFLMENVLVKTKILVVIILKLLKM